MPLAMRRRRTPALFAARIASLQRAAPAMRRHVAGAPRRRCRRVAVVAAGVARRAMEASRRRTPPLRGTRCATRRQRDAAVDCGGGAHRDICATPRQPAPYATAAPMRMPMPRLLPRVLPQRCRATQPQDLPEGEAPSRRYGASGTDRCCQARDERERPRR